jgi:hypothetical protein
VIETTNEARQALALRGFRWMVLDGNGDVPSMAMSTYAWDVPFMDAVVVHSDDDTITYRSKLESYADPFMPRNVVWHRRGTFVEAVAELVKLSPPGEREESSAVVEPPNVLWVPDGKKRYNLEELREFLGI